MCEIVRLKGKSSIMSQMQKKDSPTVSVEKKIEKGFGKPTIHEKSVPSINLGKKDANTANSQIKQ